MNLFVEHDRRAKAQDILARFDNIKDRGQAMRQTVLDLMTLRAELIAGAEFDDADVAAFDARVTSAASQLLTLIKSTLESTATLQGRVHIQFDGVEL